MNYYTQSEDGTIKDFANWQFVDSAIATDKEIVIGYDGKYYFAGAEPPQPVEEVQNAAYQLLKAKRLEEEYLGPYVLINDTYVRFPCEVKDETRLNSLATVFASHPEYVADNWKVSDGVYVTMDLALYSRVRPMGMTHISRTFDIERVKRDEITACTTAQQVEDWIANQLDTGWDTMPKAD